MAAIWNVLDVGGQERAGNLLVYLHTAYFNKKKEVKCKITPDQAQS